MGERKAGKEKSAKGGKKMPKEGEESGKQEKGKQDSWGERKPGKGKSAKGGKEIPKEGEESTKEEKAPG